MKSIQGRLIFTLLAALVLVLLATAALLFRAIRAQWVAEFDKTSLAEAGALQSLVSIESGKIDFEYNPVAMPQYARKQSPDYFQIRYASGDVLARSPSLQSATLQPIAATTQDLLLPDGRPGRAASVQFYPQPETPSETSPAPPALTVQVARDRAALDNALHGLLRTLLLSFAGVTIAVIGAVVLIVRFSLAPLRRISERVGQIDATQLHLRLPPAALPAELAPIHARLNELLARLDEAFARERRFTSDVAHELRTPIAELRSVTEVALRWPGDVKSSSDALLESHDIARQMQTLVTTLLALVRSDRIPLPQLSPVALREAVQKALLSLRGLKHVEIDIPSDATIVAEPALLASVLRNVLENALSYRDGDSTVVCESELQSNRWVLSVRNRATHLAPEDLPHVFEPFWRKDSARSDSSHSGLGLALVQRYCALIGASVQVTLRDQTFCIEISFLREENHAHSDDDARLVGGGIGGNNGAGR